MKKILFFISAAIVVASISAYWFLSYKEQRFIEERNEAFLKKYGTKSFEDFMGMSWAIRDRKEKNRLIIVLQFNKSSNSAIFDIDSNSVILKSNYQFINEMEFDTSKIRKLAAEFTSFNICYLKVDSSNNVTVMTTCINHSPFLVRVEKDSKDIPINKVKLGEYDKWFQTIEK